MIIKQNLARRLSIATACAITPLVHAQLAIDWFTIDGGGGTSTGGVYAISGTIGYPDAGKLTGASYILASGFWTVIQQEGLPPLSIEMRAGTLVLTWPAPASGVILQSATQLATIGSGWSEFTGNPVRVQDRFELILGPATTAASSIRFFRLHKP